MKFISYLFLIISLASGITKNKTTKAFNKEDLFLGDATTSQIEEYYGDFSKYSGEDLINYLYSVISKDNTFVSYSAVSNWYKITDRNYSISNPIDPTSYDFSQDNGTTYYLNNMYISSSSNNDPTKAISNAVNSLKVDSSISRVTYTTTSDNKITGTKPNYIIQVDKEHVWPKSHGFKSKDDNDSDLLPKGAPTDLHNLVAADHNTNSAGHNDLYFGEVEDKSESNAVYAYLADGSREVSGWKDLHKDTFEPKDEWKGNIARCLLYMATRYSKDIDGNSQEEPFLVLDNTSSYPFPFRKEEFDGFHPNLDTILKWHEQDPVDDYERHRNNLIYFNVQNNRNPYIDFPYLAKRAFSKDYDFSQLKEKYNIHLDNIITLKIYLPQIDSQFELKSVTYDEEIIKLEDNSKVTPLKVGSTDIVYVIHDTKENTDVEFKTTINIKDKLEYVGPTYLPLQSFDKIDLDLRNNIKNLYDDEIISFKGGLPSCISSKEDLLQAKIYGDGEIIVGVKSKYLDEIYDVTTIKVKVRLSTGIITAFAIVLSIIIVAVVIIIVKKKKKVQTK